MLYSTVIEICLVERFYCITSNILELKHSQQSCLKSIPLRFLSVADVYAHFGSILESIRKMN